MKSKTILGADGTTKMRQITVGIHGKGGEAGIRGRRSSSNRRVRKRVQAVAADTTTLTEKMRAALRISSTSEKITEEINDCSILRTQQ